MFLKLPIRAFLLLFYNFRHANQSNFGIAVLMRALVPDPTVSFTPAISICLPISIPVQRLLCFHTFAVYDAF